MIRILDVARAQLAIDLNCTEEDLLQEEQIRFCPAAMRKGCRTRKRQKPFLEAVTMGQVSVFCATANHFSYQKRLSGTKLFCSGSR